MLGLLTFLKDWVRNGWERNQVINSFNTSAKHAYYSRQAMYLAKARTTFGNSEFKHSLSRMRSGFTVKIYGAYDMNKSQASDIADAILNNGPMIRQLMAIGYDTIEIETENYRFQWDAQTYNNLFDYTLSS